MNEIFDTIGIVGSGAMGRGIAQIAAQAGSTVMLYDQQPAATQQAIAAIQEQWERLVAKGKMSAAYWADKVKW